MTAFIWNTKALQQLLDESVHGWQSETATVLWMQSSGAILAQSPAQQESSCIHATVVAALWRQYVEALSKGKETVHLNTMTVEGENGTIIVIPVEKYLICGIATGKIVSIGQMRYQLEQISIALGPEVSKLS